MNGVDGISGIKGTFTESSECIQLTLEADMLVTVKIGYNSSEKKRKACVYLNGTKSKLEIEWKCDSRRTVSPFAASDKSSRTFVT